MMVRPSRCLPLLFGVALLSCIVDHPVHEFSPALFDDQARPSIGYFKHRGTMYNLHDLMDPQFRSSHHAPYVRDFNPNVGFGHGPVWFERRMEPTWIETRMGPVWIEMDMQSGQFIIRPEQLPNPEEEPTQSFEREP